MKKMVLLIFVIVFSSQLYAEEEPGKPKPQTRSLSAQEAFPMDSISASPLLRSFDGLKRARVQKAYRDLKAAADSIAEADSLSTGLLATNWRYVKQFFVDVREGPERAMSLIAAVVLALLLIITVPYMFITYFIPPSFKKVIKPENDPNAQTDEVNQQGDAEDALEDDQDEDIDEDIDEAEDDDDDDEEEDVKKTV